MTTDWDNQDKIHLLGMSDVKMQEEIRILANQKQSLAGTLAAAAHDRHAYPLVALTDGKKIVEYNIKVDIPKDWIIDPETGAVDTNRLPDKAFETPYRMHGHIDYPKFDERASALGLRDSAYDREFELHNAHNIVAHSEELFVTEKFRLLRDRDGHTKDGAALYELPPTGRGHVTGPKDEASAPKLATL